MEDATVLATMSDEENQESETFAFDSDKEYTRASSQTRNDEAYDEERWWSEGKCIHCKDTDLCYIYKYGPFCINIANTNRERQWQDREMKFSSWFLRYVSQRGCLFLMLTMLSASSVRLQFASPLFPPPNALFFEC